MENYKKEEEKKEKCVMHSSVGNVIKVTLANSHMMRRFLV